MNASQPIASELTNAPIYLRVASLLRQQIATGDIRSGDTLPSERDLCALIGASRVTIRKAIDQLVGEGLLVRKRGSGTFVAPRIEAPGSFLSGFSEDAAARGATAGVVWIEKSLSEASDEEARILEIITGVPVVRLTRVRLANGEPLAIENAVVPAQYLSDIAALGDSLYDALTAAGNRPVGGTQRIRAALATPGDAALLHIPEKSEILRIERVTRLADGQPVEFTRSAYRGDRYDFVSELRGGFSVS